MGNCEGARQCLARTGVENGSNWLAVAVGNSRLHWAWFKHDKTIATWDTNHLSNPVAPNRLPQKFLHPNLTSYLNIPVYLASVVAAQTEYWLGYGHLVLVSLKDIELSNTYPSLGIDRALAASGAVATYKQSCLVIDGGTALTFTGITKQRKLIGGAILPGLRSQLLTLSQKTSALPEIVLPSTLPPRWALDTDTAIASGILHTAIAGIYSYITDWQRHPHSKIIFTGGDGELLVKLFRSQFPQLGEQITVDLNLVIWGLKLVYLQRQDCA